MLFGGAAGGVGLGSCGDAWVYLELSLMEVAGVVELGGGAVLERIRAVLDGQVPVWLADPAISAKGVDHGVVAFDLAGMQVAFYFDCGDLDYCQWAEDRGGQRGEFDRWYDLGTEPVAMLDEADQERLRELLVAAVA